MTISTIKIGDTVWLKCVVLKVDESDNQVPYQVRQANCPKSDPTWAVKSNVKQEEVK